VLVFILCIVHAGIRREDAPDAAEFMTASQVLAALRIARDLGEQAKLAPELSAKDENITAISTARGRKDEARA
jgi:hypothetical protein